MERLVTAIITTHNRCELALKAIDSVINQTYDNIELIVVDDASELEYSEQIKEHAIVNDYRYIYIDKSESLGGNHARNVGIVESNGEYIAFLDDDDEWFPTKISKQVSYLENNTDYGVVACGRLYEEDFTHRAGDEVEKLPEGDLSTYIYNHIPYTTSAIMVRKEMFELVGEFDENLKFWQEYELEMRLARATRFGVVRENLVLYRIISNDTARLTNKLSGWDDSIKYIEKKHKEYISAQDKSIRKSRKRMIANDGIDRAIRAGKSKRKYLFMLFCDDPCWQNLVKVIFNVRKLREILEND